MNEDLWRNDMIIKHKAKRVDSNEEVIGYVTKMWGQYHIIKADDENTAYPVLENTIEPCIVGECDGCHTDKKMDKKDILGKLGIIAAAAWLILFILAFSMDRSSRMGDVLILSAFAGVLPMIFFTIGD